MAASPGPIIQDRADELRTAMVNSLREEGVIVSDRVAATFSAVPRHLFAPGETLEAAYAPHGTVVPRRDADGLLLSVIPAPNIQTMMLEPAGIEPGMRVLGVGSGGYNAAERGTEPGLSRRPRELRHVPRHRRYLVCQVVDAGRGCSRSEGI